MSKKPAVTAAGAVVFRDKNGARQVLLVHRPAYDDWSLPKGKIEPDEDIPVAAVRETLEETGAIIRLGARLPSLSYTVSKGRKVVHFWVGYLLKQKQRRPYHEVDKVRWVSVAEAAEQLTYDDERRLLALATDLPVTNQLVIVRHGKAMLRKNWDGNDQRRPLNGRGRRQSRRLTDLLAAYGVTKLVSSESKRCVQTLEPYAEAAGVQITKVELLTEEAAEKRPKAVVDYMAGLVKDSATQPIAVCGHRPVLPAMQSGAGIKPKPMLTAE